MRTFIITILSCLIIPVLCVHAARAQQHEPQDRMGFILSGGFKQMKLRYASYEAATFELTLHNHFNDIDFNGSFAIGKDYVSMEPFALVGMLGYYFMKYGEYEDGGNGGMIGLVVMGCAVSSMSFNIRIGDHFNIRPYWSLLRLTKLKNLDPYLFDFDAGIDDYLLNAAVGGYITGEFGRFTLSPYWEYSFGYEKDNPFKGQGFGVMAGIKLFDPAKHRKPKPARYKYEYD